MEKKARTLRDNLQKSKNRNYFYIANGYLLVLFVYIPAFIISWLIYLISIKRFNFRMKINYIISLTYLAVGVSLIFKGNLISIPIIYIGFAGWITTYAIKTKYINGDRYS